MPSLKDLRNRIGSVKKTRKITSAMKLVAASKLRRAEQHAREGQPYAKRMSQMLARTKMQVLAGGGDDNQPLLTGTGKDEIHLVVVVGSDRGLCGGFNANLIRQARRNINALALDGKRIKLLCVGRKVHDVLSREFPQKIVGRIVDLSNPRLSFEKAEDITSKILALFDEGEFDVCHVLYNRFRNAVTQIPTSETFIPYTVPKADMDQLKDEEEKKLADETAASEGIYEFEPNAKQVLDALLVHQLATQIYRVLLETAAGEQAARMTAMDGATRNAGDMIGKLTLKYNRERQAYITKELCEIVSAIEAMS